MEGDFNFPFLKLSIAVVICLPPKRLYICLEKSAKEIRITNVPSDWD